MSSPGASRLRAFVAKLRGFLRGRRRDTELDDEIQEHLHGLTERFVAQGMSRKEAAAAARRRFGNTTLLQEDHRELQTFPSIEAIWQDLRYGWRGLLHAPGFLLTVTVTIALGLGVNTALFTLFDAYYLRPIPVRDPHSLYGICWVNRSGDVNHFSWPEYREFLAQNPAFSEAAAFRSVEVRLAGRRLSGMLVTDDYFRMLGVRPALGRTLLPGDASPSAPAVVVLAHTTWQSQFSAASDIVGKKILLRGHPFTVVGVAPPEFTGLGARLTGFWAPITLASVVDPSSDLCGPSRPRAFEIVARLKSGFTLRKAENGAALWARRITSELPSAEQAIAAISFSLATRKEFNPRNNAAFFSLVLVAFAAILVIACTNVANMMLARSVARQREIGVRLALGASRGRLIRQLLTESTLLVLPSAALGILLSRGIIKACLWLLVTTLPPGIARFMNRIPPLSPDIRVLAFSLAAAFLAAMVCGLAPALQSSRANLTQAARGDFGNWRPSRVTSALLAGQIVVCVLMLVTAGVMLRGIKGVQALEVTLSTRNAIELVIHEDSRARVLDRISREPALPSLAAAGSAPVERKPIAFVKSASGAILASAANTVSPEYFSTFDIPLLRGRNFTGEEARSGSPVVLLSQTAASQLWPNQEPEKSLDLVADQAASAAFRRNQTVAVVGIVGDELSRWISGGESKAIIYFPTDSKTPGTKLFLGVHGDAEPVIHRLDADLPDALEEMDALQIRRWVMEEAYSFHIVYWFAMALGSLALLLTLSGIYGVVAHIVSQRTKEIGIRMALGATTRSVERLVLKQSMRLAVTGGIVGCMFALGVSKILSSILQMINTYDVAVYAGAIVFVWMACAAAAYLPARRTTRIEPTVTLRHE